MATRWIIGLAAGPSVQGTEAALLELTGRGLALQTRVLHWLSEPYPKELRELLLKTSTSGQADVRQVSLAHCVLGETFARLAQRIADQASVSLQNVLCLGGMGHTAWHEPEHRFPSTLCLGAAAVIAERTGLTAVTDFRTRDVAGGGQGAPLGVLPDHLLFRTPREDRLVIHLGGLAHATYLPAGEDLRHLLGWEVGPCTVLLDGLMHQLSSGKELYDPGGKQAVQGRQIPELLNRWAHHPFVLRRPPKSSHRASFGEEFVQQTLLLARQKGWGFFDLLCTANHFVARTIGSSLRRYLPKPGPPDHIYLAGGGVRNGMLWRLLEEQFPDTPLERTDALGVPAEATAAVHAGLLAGLTLDGVAANLPSSTGASGARLLGSLTPGSAANWSRCLAWMNGQESGPADEDD
jgi:anhydro-N-acetylmuramic acid kinase